jgi:hypothetical protein
MMVGKLVAAYTALQPRRQPSSYSPLWKPLVIKNFSYKTQRNGLLGKSRNRLEDNIKTNLKGTIYEAVHCIHMPQMWSSAELL